MLDLLQAPYNTLRNYDEFLTALRQITTAEEAEIWRSYPDYTLKTVSCTPAQISIAIKPEIHPRLKELSRSLADKGLLIEENTPSGERGYIRNYLFAIANYLIYHPDDTLLSDACYHWFRDLVDREDSAKLREIYPEYRVLPHEGALTGDQKYGRIPMNLDIPDTRETFYHK